jgi:hypothetical protein
MPVAITKSSASIHLKHQPDYASTSSFAWPQSRVDILLVDASKAWQVTGWEAKVNFRQLVRLMVDPDLELTRQEQPSRNQWRSRDCRNSLGNNLVFANHSDPISGLT